MSRVFYGADPFAFTGAGKLGIELEICKVVEFYNQPIWDGPTYLWTRFRLHIHAIFNPEATSWIPGGLFIGGDPTVEPTPTVHGRVPSQGVPPAWTDVAIRHFLMQPRRQLLFIVGKTIVLSSPEILFVNNPPANPLDPPTVPCDAFNGPMPIHCNVTAIKGTKTFLVDFAIETFVNECIFYKAASLLTVVASHRWTMEDDIDEDMFTTRTIRGHAIFKSDLLNVVQKDPDAYRSFLMHPIADTFKREHVHVTVNEDDNRLDYVIVDRELNLNYHPNTIAQNVTRIEAWFSRGINRLGAYDAFNNLPVVGPYLAGIWGVRAGLANVPAPGPAPARFAGNGPWLANAVGAGLLQAGRWAADRIVPGFDAMVDLATAIWRVPRCNSHISLKIWGNRASKRFSLYTVGIQILLYKIGLDSLVAGTSSISVTEDLMGAFVSIEADYTSSPDPKAYGITLKKTFQALDPPITDVINNVTLASGQPAPSLGTINPAQNPYPIGGRGTYLEILTAHLLTNPCAEETVPVEPEKVVELTTDPQPGDPVQLTTDPAKFAAIKELQNQNDFGGGDPGLP